MNLIKNFNISIDTNNNTNNTINQEKYIMLLCVIKNEYLLLEYFLKHYSNIGVTHFIFIDNDSSDESLNYLLNSDYNILLFSTTESFKENKSGSKWVHKLLKEYCINKWCVVVDCDEIININNLNNLIDEMEKENSNVCKFYLLDMYAKDIENKYIRGESFLSHSNYYDKKSLNDNNLRKRVMKINVCLEKKSFFKYNFYDDNYISEGWHFIHKYNEKNSVIYFSKTQYLLHFKFIKPNLKEVFSKRVENNQDWNNSCEYIEYCKHENYNFYDPEYSLCIFDVEPLFNLF